MTTTAKLEYDSRLGGSVQLPEAVSTYRYCGDRVAEIKQLLGAIRHPNQTKLVFQTLPKHMRRRAMSHNPKRLPRRHRAAHIAQMRKSGLPAAGAAKRTPSRKYRRKAGNLQREYVRRQRQHRWLETHLWHAKRFHMTERWGYRLALRSCDKTFRRSYRASAEHCLLQDVSYVGAVEVSGELAVLREGFARVTSADCGLGVCARTFVHGGREAQVELFGVDRYPFGAIGKVDVIWRPADETDEQRRTAWMFVHASFYADVVQLLRDVFTLISTAADAKTPDKDANKPPLPSYHNSQTGTTLTELRDTLNRFRLTGPLSQAVLAKAFTPKNPLHPEEDPDTAWFPEHLRCADNAAAHESQRAFWSAIRTVRSAAELTPNMVLALNIEDPRLNRPQKRTKAVPPPTPIHQIRQHSNAAAATMPLGSNRSALWSLELRDRISAAKVTSAEYCRRRNEHVLVPGARCAFEDGMQPVPVLLVQRPGSEQARTKRLGYAGGWDVIVPQGYGISTWMCLVMWGARPGGLRETETVAREAGREEFWPDTVPSRVLAAEEEQRRKEEFFKKPQNKRINYNKLSVNSPFRCRWSQLVDDWSTTTPPTPSQFYVLRNRAQLQLCQQAIDRRLPFAALVSQIPHPDRCLIPLAVRQLSRGTLSAGALVCVPRAVDFRRQRQLHAALDAQPLYTEPMRSDAGEPERKRLRLAHLRLLKRLRARRVRTKRRRQEHAERRVLIAPPQTAQLVREQLQRMRELWLPAVVATVRGQCSREVCGFVTQADFSLSEATVAGVAYVTLMAVKKLLLAAEKGGESGDGKKKKRGGKRGSGLTEACRVMVRETTSRQYRLATLRVCAE